MTKSGCFFLTFLSVFPYLPGSAWADISFIQISQAQTSQGKDSFFGKTWVSLSGLKMRLVSGYARKLTNGKNRQPRRVIQILDLSQKTRFLIHPEKKTYMRAPLAEIEYGPETQENNKPAKSKQRLRIKSLTLKRTAQRRRFLDTECEHYRIRAELLLTAKGAPGKKARFDQDVWVAPIQGALSKTLLDLIAFENAYREATGGALSPLDHERYQVREAASYLEVPPAELRKVVERIRKGFHELASYPVASSVAWRRLEQNKAPPTQAPVLAKSSERHLAKGGQFVVLDWHNSEREINRLADAPTSERRWAFLKLKTEWLKKQKPVHYREFQEDMKKTIALIYGPPPPQPQRTPFYQIYAELHGLESSAKVPDKDLSLPTGYIEAPP